MDQSNYFQIVTLGIGLLTGGVAGGAVGIWWQSRKRSAIAEPVLLSPVFKTVLDSTHDAMYLLKVVPVEGSRALRFRVEDCNEPAAR